MSIISVQGVSKIFRHRTSGTLLRDHVRDMVTKPSREGFYAVRNASFEVAERESVALIGANGAGKSTMLALVCGLARPDEGAIHVGGSIAPLLELGSGFHPDLTGRENYLINGALQGMNEKQSKEQFPAILEFSELEDFIDEPLRTYSAGMVLRLAFSIATHCNSGILIIDEILGVGDANFQFKCQKRIEKLRAEGQTFLVVSHSTPTVREFCDRVIWLHHGQVIADGPAGPVVDEYTRFMLDPHQAPPQPSVTPVHRPEPAPPVPAPAGTARHGSKKRSG